jgi:hypothetical protein
MNTRTVLAALLLVAAPSAFAQCLESNPSGDFPQDSGAIYRIYMPEESCWNGDLVIYAHGFVPAQEPIAIPENQLVADDGTSVPGLVNALGFAFAVTSYSTNGLAVLQGLADVRDLVDRFEEKVSKPRFVYIVGPSEGGLVTTLAVERFPSVFDGGVAACGPIGDFHLQLNYFANFRLLFDYFFPNLLPGGPTQVPAELENDWEEVYAPLVSAAIAAKPSATNQLLRVANAPVGSDPSTIEETVLGLLRYNAVATNDAFLKLGGSPFDNRNTLYLGSSNDLKLNLTIRRYSPDPAALAALPPYQTAGALARPLITMHTTGDPIVPYPHEFLYRLKTYATGSGASRINLPITRYGHCAFTGEELVVSFALMLLKSQGLSALSALPSSLLPADKLDAARSLVEPPTKPTPAAGRSSDQLPLATPRSAGPLY